MKSTTTVKENYEFRRMYAKGKTGVSSCLRIREIFRLSQGKMTQGYDCIVVARTRAAHADYWELKRAFEKTCKKLDLWEIQA